MSTYVLIHGAWHGAWAWEKVAPLLEQNGHKVEAVDLPGHGNDATPISEVTLQAYTECVCQVLDAQSEPVILVGHSMGGIVITQAAEQRPDKIKTLVYLSAFLIRNGESLLQVAQSDTQSLVLPNLIMSEDEHSTTIRGDAIKDVFYADCSEDDAERAKERLVPQAAAILSTPITTSEANFGRIPRIYIECLQDKAIAPDLQKTMYTSLPCQRVISMNTSHSPFFSAPKELAAHLSAL